MSESHSTPKSYYVYILCRPPRGKQAQGKPFYVGKGKGNRVYDHELEARRGCECHKCHVIRKVWRNGGQIQRYIIFTTTNETEALAYEVETIALYGRKNLTNHTDGGDGVSNLSPEARAKISAASKSRPAPSLAARAKMSAASKARPISPETRKKMAASLRGHHPSPETRAKLSAAVKSRLASPEARLKMSAASKAHPPATAETRARLSAGAKARYADPEKRAKHDAGQKARWARYKAAKKAAEQAIPLLRYAGIDL